MCCSVNSMPTASQPGPSQLAGASGEEGYLCDLLMTQLYTSIHSGFASGRLRGGEHNVGKTRPGAACSSADECRAAGQAFGQAKGLPRERSAPARSSAEACGQGEAQDAASARDRGIPGPAKTRVDLQAHCPADQDQ